MSIYYTSTKGNSAFEKAIAKAHSTELEELKNTCETELVRKDQAIVSLVFAVYDGTNGLVCRRALNQVRVSSLDLDQIGDLKEILEAR